MISRPVFLFFFSPLSPTLNFAFYHIQTISRCGSILQRKNSSLRKRSAPYSCGQRRHHPQTRSDVGVEINGRESTNHLSAPPPQRMCALGTCPRRDEASLKGRGASSSQPNVSSVLSARLQHANYYKYDRLQFCSSAVFEILPGNGGDFHPSWFRQPRITHMLIYEID